MKKNKKKKAFTLIELLAVIMILAIISLIVTVSIGRLIDNARKETYKESVRGIIRSAELYMGKYVLANHKDPVYPIVFTCDGTACSNGADKLDFSGEVPKSGTLTLIDHKTVKAEYLSSGKYCASGTKTELQVSKSCADIDITKPTVDGTLQGNILHLTLIDNESGIASYCVATSDSTNGCSWINTTNSNVEYTLSVSGTYYVFAKDKKDNVSIGKEFITGDIEKPTVTAELDGKIIDIEVFDNASVVEYCVVSTNDSSSCTWNTISENSFGHTLSEAGTYYVFAKDSSGNISDSVEIIAPTSHFEIETIWDSSGTCNVSSCTNNYASKSWSGVAYWNSSRASWDSVTGSAAGPSFTMDLTYVTKINYVYSIAVSGSYDSYGTTRFTVNCGGLSAAVSTSRSGGDNNASRSGTLSLDVSSLTGEVTCTSSGSFTGNGANRDYGYNVGGSYSISRIYPSY